MYLLSFDWPLYVFNVNEEYNQHVVKRYMGCLNSLSKVWLSKRVFFYEGPGHYSCNCYYFIDSFAICSLQLSRSLKARPTSGNIQLSKPKQTINMVLFLNFTSSSILLIFGDKKSKIDTRKYEYRIVVANKSRLRIFQLQKNVPFHGWGFLGYTTTKMFNS